MRIAPLLACLSLLIPPSLLLATTPADTPWETLTASDGSTAEPRHESGAVVVNGKLYLVGGRQMRMVQAYDPATQTWTDLAPTPLEIHHFQPVAVGDSIYIIGGFTCCYPDESAVAEIHVFNTKTLTWSINGSIPAARLRGSAAAVVRNDIIYLLGGNTLGHSGGAVAWFDSYNPATDVWTVLPDAPNARDHFSGAIVADYLVAAAGRQTALPNPFKNAVAQTDLYDFITGTWSSANAIPTLRAGALAVAAGDEIIVAGGEINTSTLALDTVEALNVYSGQWRSLQNLNVGRHSGGGAVLNGQFHVVAGSINTGGAPETDSHETLPLVVTSSTDYDADGLSNNDERGEHGTNPRVADTDFDSLDDYQELIEYLSNPLLSDTDADGIDDGVEVNVWMTNPVSADTDSDGLNDYDEAYLHNTNPLDEDTDADQLSDEQEILEHMTDPTNSDTDADGMNDGEEVQTGRDPLTADENNPPNTPPTTTSSGSSGGSVSILLLGALLVGRLSRIRLTRVNVLSNSFNI